MKMFEETYLDAVLVPLGFLIFLFYHLFLLYRVLYFPYTTAIGFTNYDKEIWVARIMKAGTEEIGSALKVLTERVSVATFFASVSLALSSLVGAWLGNSLTSSTTHFKSAFIYGNKSSTTMTIKFATLIASFVFALACFVQSISYFMQANLLLTTPGGDISVEIVRRAVVLGGSFWTIGLRALYMAGNLIFWLFGPIPMLASSVLTTFGLWLLDSHSPDVPLHHRRFRDEEIAMMLRDGADESVIFVDREI